MAGIDINRTTAGAADLLPKAVSTDIWSTVLEQSQVMRLGRQVPMTGAGMTIPIITGDPVASWVNETDNKPISRGSFTTRSATPYKVAVIEPFSNEFRRDLPGLYAELARRLPSAIAKAFDKAVLFGPAPGTGFDTLAASPAVSVGTGAAAYGYAGLLGALSTVAAVEDADLSAWLLSPQAEIGLLGALDADNRPLYTQSANTDGVGAIGSLLGRPVFKSKSVFNATTTPDTVGFAGDWSQLMYGVVSGITVRVSDQATLTDGATQINLWQRNMFALLVEAEIGCVVRNDDAFVRLTLAA